MRTQRRATRLRIQQIREHLLRERGTALDTRDPLAIRRAGDRYKAIIDALGTRGPAEVVDLDEITLSLKDAAKALGLTTREVRAMARDGRLPTRMVGHELRVPLTVVL